MFLLVLGTLLSFISVHSSLIGKQIIKWINKPTTKERELLSQKQELQKEQSTINMMENFAKYSKIQRKINTLDEKLTDSRNEKNSLSLQLGLTYGIRALFGLLLLMFSILYRNTPVFTVDKKIDLTPFNYIISYPNSENIVSFHFWILCCTAVARLIKIP